MDAPSFLTPSRMGDPRTAMSKYHPRLAKLSVNTPDTTFVSPTVDEATEEILQVMEQNNWSEAFVRSDYKAAPQRIEAGSVIDERTEKRVRTTLESLSVQLSNSPWPIGNHFVVREMLDFDYCMEPSHRMDHPEIRFFVEGGDVLGRFPQDYTSSMLCEKRYTFLDDVVDTATPPVSEAQEVADEFDEYHWCADFALTENGNWYCVELNFGGVRWDSEQERWRNMCGYGDAVATSPEVIHGPVIRDVFRPPE